MPGITSPAAQRLVLDNVSWQTYEALLRALDERHLFLTYDQVVWRS